MTRTSMFPMNYLEHLCVRIGPRVLGSRENQAAAEYVRRAVEGAGLAVEMQEFACPLWEEVETRLDLDGESLTAYANSWSPPCDATAQVVAVGTSAELETADMAGRIALLYGDLTKGHGMGARSAFYFPEDHQRVVRLLEERQPAALITVSPIPGCTERLTRDWELAIPAATVLPEVGRLLLRRGGTLRLRIECRRAASRFANVLARVHGRQAGRIVLLAHMDTQADTPGACDNGSGVAVLLALAEVFAGQDLQTGVEWFFSNGEELGGVGDAEYLRRCGEHMDEILAVVNVDGVGQWASVTSVALMGGSPGLHDHVGAVLTAYPGVVSTAPWYESDHTAFYLQGVPCIPITSVGINNSHMPGDTIEWISPARLGETVALVADIVTALQGKSPAWCRE